MVQFKFVTPGIQTTVAIRMGIFNGRMVMETWSKTPEPPSIVVGLMHSPVQWRPSSVTEYPNGHMHWNDPGKF